MSPVYQHVIFRVDASKRIGYGHVMRCLALADCLRDRGSIPTFVMRRLEGNIIQHVREKFGFQVLELEQPQSIISTALYGDELHATSLHREWLEVDWRQDADDTAKCLSLLRSNSKALIVDHYAIETHWEKRLRSKVDLILVIDDLADRNHECDILVDQTFCEQPWIRYEGLIPASARTFLGPEFALLRKEFAQFRKFASVRKGAVRRILVFFGGTDNENQTLAVMESLLNADFKDILVDVIVGGGNSNAKAISELCSKRDNTNYYHQVNNMAEMISQADMAISASGTNTWERLCLGLPSLVAATAENQLLVGQELHRHELVEFLGRVNASTHIDYGGAIASFIENSSKREHQSSLGMHIVDGCGAQRIATLLDKTMSAESCNYRRAEPKDMLTYFHWANEAENRRQSFHSSQIALRDHREWFSRHLVDSDCQLWILESGSQPAAQLRLTRTDDVIWISFSVAPQFRGKGIGGKLLKEAPKLKKAQPEWKTCTLQGAVKVDNKASHRAFLKAGYIDLGETEIANSRCNVYSFPQEKP